MVLTPKFAFALFQLLLFPVVLSLSLTWVWGWGKGNIQWRAKKPFFIFAPPTLRSAHNFLFDNWNFMKKSGYITRALFLGSPFPSSHLFSSQVKVTTNLSVLESRVMSPRRERILCTYVCISMVCKVCTMYVSVRRNHIILWLFVLSACQDQLIGACKLRKQLLWLMKTYSITKCYLLA
jgi:hypothetical protein